MKSKILLSILTASILQGCGGAEAKASHDNGESTQGSRQLWLNGDIYTVNKAQPKLG